MEHLLALVKPGEPDIAAGKAKQKNADQHAAAETTGKQALYAWADAVLKTCGLDEAVERAKTRDDLDRIKLDRDDPDVMLAIRDALRPVSKHPDEHFRELKPEQLKRLLEIRLNELKKPKFKAIIEKLTKEESADDRKHGVEYYGDNFKVTDRGVFHYRELALKGLLAALL